MSKIEEAKEILKGMGVHKEQQNDMSALTLLALCGIKEDSKWKDATKGSKRITKEIMSFVNNNYKSDSPYAPNTRETFRRQVLHQFVQAGIASYNPDDPSLPVNSPKAHYSITDEALMLIRSYGSRDWESNKSRFAVESEHLLTRYSEDREIQRIPLNIEGTEYLLSPGKHNEVQAAVVKHFTSIFVPDGTILYLGDTEKKNLFIDEKHLNALKLPLTEHSKLPDIIISDDKKGWLFLVEVVTSHGPVSPSRLLELEEFTKDCPYGNIYVTAFPNATEFKRHIDKIAWETEVWLADNPEHMIHFNGNRFIGPR